MNTQGELVKHFTVIAQQKRYTSVYATTQQRPTHQASFVTSNQPASGHNYGGNN